MINQLSLWIGVMACLFVCFPAMGQVSLLYDFEEDSGAIVLDKLTSDGAQDGRVFNNVAFSSDDVPFGNQAAVFEAPDGGLGVPPFSTVEVPETTFGPDYSLTIAMHVNNAEMPADFTRLFSAFQGTGGLDPDRSLILDFDPTGNSGVTGLRGIANGTVVMTPSPPNGMSDPGYHHYAMTLEEGDMRLYFNGDEVAGGNVGSGFANTFNIYIGEDPHDGGGSANEQLIGNFDEVLILERALSGPEISLLADGNPVPSVVIPGNNERAVYYDFEGDRGTSITDKFTADGAQDGIVNRLVFVDDAPVNAKLGSASASIDHPGQSESIFSQIDIGPVGNLGEQFTLSAVVNVSGGGHPANGLTRLFSSFGGAGPVSAGELIFDFDPNASVEDIGMRLVVPGGSQASSDITFSTNEDHTLTVTYSDGDVVFYLDGQQVDSGTVDGGAIDLGETPLRIGEDIGGTLNENFVGIMDDVLIIPGALDGSQVAALHRDGAAEFLGIVSELLGDFDGNGLLDVNDLDALVMELATDGGSVDFDMTSDGSLDADDLAEWLRLGGESQSFSGPILPGDANLDGIVDAADLNAVGTNWQGSPNLWSGGDFDGNGVVDASDLNLVGRNWQNDVRAVAAAVPEPPGFSAGAVALLCLLGIRRRHFR